MPRPATTPAPDDDDPSSPARRQLREFAATFVLLSDRRRLCLLLHLVRAGELNVKQLCARLGRSQPMVSHQLTMLRIGGLVDRRRDGKCNYYRVLAGTFAERLHELLSAAGPIPGRIVLGEFSLTTGTPGRGAPGSSP